MKIEQDHSTYARRKHREYGTGTLLCVYKEQNMIVNFKIVKLARIFTVVTMD